MSRFPANDDKFDQVRALDLPLGQYAIVSSGALGVREVREIGDVDLIVSPEVWNVLATTNAVDSSGGFLRIYIGDIEVLGAGSNFVDRFPGAPTVPDQIAGADIIDGLPFVSLEHALYFKRKMNRPKDQADITAIEQMLKS